MSLAGIFSIGFTLKCSATIGAVGGRLLLMCNWPAASICWWQQQFKIRVINNKMCTEPQTIQLFKSTKQSDNFLKYLTDRLNCFNFNKKSPLGFESYLNDKKEKNKIKSVFILYKFKSSLVIETLGESRRST